jgi:hypothetical protein
MLYLPSSITLGARGSPVIFCLGITSFLSVCVELTQDEMINNKARMLKIRNIIYTKIENKLKSYSIITMNKKQILIYIHAK